MSGFVQHRDRVRRPDLLPASEARDGEILDLRRLEVAHLDGEVVGGQGRRRPVVEDDEVGRRVAEALQRAAKRGVAVRVVTPREDDGLPEYDRLVQALVFGENSAARAGAIASAAWST